MQVHPTLVLLFNPKLTIFDLSDRSLCFDGALGGLYDKFIVTPNASALWAPPLGSNRVMYLRSDLRYGDDDPLSWPQSYVPQYCHFPIIRSVLLNPSDSHPDARYTGFRAKLTSTKLILPANAGVQDSYSIISFAWFQKRVDKTVEHGKGTTFFEGAEDLKHSYTVLLHDLLERLQHLPMS
ncbi:uncharacterized protein ARMOST_22702 [Armillaria ostoyae]|uniref:Uncharacterized protein n=1 Tax=Armillaria ostoyae TaxID=47428 RepID=A0A284SDM5_ARMOS|nr:uncharacterized protein ARMOST_22702 [Armillaria ostoyae]